MNENIKCPNCPDAKLGCCCYCGVDIPLEDQGLSPDPYGYEIYDDDTEHMLCEKCYGDRKDDI